MASTQIGQFRRATLSALIGAILPVVGTVVMPLPATGQDTGAFPGRIAEMRHHFEDASRLHEAVIRGDLPRVHEAASALARMSDPEGVPRTTLRLVDIIRSAARRATNAPIVTDAATETVRILTQCGACHQASGVTPRPAGTPAPPAAGLAGHMRERQQALDDLLLGIVIPSDERWQQGSARLAKADIKPQSWPDSPLLAARAELADRRIVGLAGRAQTAKSPFDRAGIYANLITACGNCHAYYPEAWGPKPR